MNWHDFKCGFFYGIITALLIWFSIFLVSNWGTESPSSSSVGGVGDTAPLTIYNVSAYCPCERCCGEFADGITASGQPAEGFFVAASPEIPFGTLLSIPGYNNGLPVPVLDRGGAIKGNKIDVFFPTHSEALQWGRQYLNIERR